MDNIEEGFIKLTNYTDHPTNKAYKVFFFYKKEQADYFKLLLEKENLFFELEKDKIKRGDIYLFGIKKTDNKKVTKLNYITLGKFRTRFISQKWAQFLILSLGFIIFAFALFSFLKNNRIF